MSATFFDGVSVELMKSYEELLQSYYLQLDPGADVANGSVIHELVIRPAAALYARNEVSLEAARTQYSLNLLAASASPDEAIAENLASNFRMTRRAGLQGSGTLAVYTNQTGNVYLPSNSRFTAGGVALLVAYNYVGVLDEAGYTDTDTTKYRQLVQTGTSEWAFLVQALTVDNTDATVGEGAPAVLDGANVQITRLEVVSAVSGGSGEEGIASLVNRARYGITAKVPSGRAHLQALFAENTSVQIYGMATTGMGDAEMLRDRNNPFLISVGGRVDAFCRTAPLPSTLTVAKTATTADGGSTWNIRLERNDAPGFYYISRIVHATNPRTITDPEAVTMTYGYQQMTDGPEVFNGTVARYSPYQTANASFSYPGLAGGTNEFLVSLVAMPFLEDLQEFVNSEPVRNRAQDVLVRAPAPAYVGMELKLRCTADCSGVDTAALQNYLATFVNGLAVGRGFLGVADLAVAVNTAYPNLTLSFPTKLSMQVFMPDGSVYSEETSEGMLAAHEDLAQGVSAVNTVFLCRPGDVAVTIESVA